MTQAGTRQPARTADPLRAALDDPGVLAELTRHAAARLGVLLADRRPAVRADEAREAVQEAGRRALERAADFDPTRSAEAWLHGILERVLHERCRSLRKQPAQPAADPAAWDGLEARPADADPLGELTRVLDDLPDDYRTVLTLRYLDGMTHEQIAARLNISRVNSRVRVGRAVSAARALAAKGGGR